MQRTVYDQALPPGTKRPTVDKLAKGVAKANPGAKVTVVVHRAKGSPTTYRVVAQLPKAKA